MSDHQIQHGNDSHRPHYHFLPPTSWMNDPNGLCQWKGEYHLFYQHNPHEARFGAMHWGHAVSPDLVHWEHLPIALAPTPESHDEDGCWSGCFVNNNGTPTLIYSGFRKGERIQFPCLATSNDERLIKWQKYEGNPIIAESPAELAITEFRDHCIWREGETWYQLIGSGIKGIGGTALLYRSADLIHWDYMHPLCVGDKNETDEMWECPDFFPLSEDKYLLTVSSHPKQGITHYFIGTYQNHRFTPETQGVFDFSKHFYAPQSLRDDQGRRILFGWLREGRDEAAQMAAGWSGVMSLPRILSLNPDQTLRMEPAPELTGLRGHQYQIGPQDITHPTTLLEEPPVCGLELLAEFTPADSNLFGLTIQYASDNSEHLTITFTGEELSIEQVSPKGTQVERGAFALPKGENLQLHIFLDGSVVEVFANYTACITERMYFNATGPIAIQAFTHGGNAHLVSLDIWEMQSVWNQ